MSAVDPSGKQGQRASLADIAKACGVSAMTVSRALRNDAKVAEATRQAVLAAAEAAGYRLDPKIGQLMQHLRSVRARPTSEPLALVWPDCTLREREESPSLAGIARGVRMRAEALGFSLDEYFLKEPGMTAARLDRILHARGVSCLVFGQVVRRSHAHVKMRWDHYCVATIGLGLWRPEFHRVQFYHYDGMMQVMRWLKHLGKKRVACILDATTNERMMRAWEAAFLTFHPLGHQQAGKLLFLSSAAIHGESRAWLGKAKPDAVVAEGATAASLGLPPGVLYVSLNRVAELGTGAGLDQQDHRLGAAAVDLVSAHFTRNERGIPEAPKILLMRGTLVK